jgi:hypothetical protein
MANQASDLWWTRPHLNRVLMVITCMPGTIWMCKTGARKCLHRFATRPRLYRDAAMNSLTPAYGCGQSGELNRLGIHPIDVRVRGWPVTCQHKPPPSWQPVFCSWRSRSSHRTAARYSAYHAFNYAHKVVVKPRDFTGLAWSNRLQLVDG